MTTPPGGGRPDSSPPPPAGRAADVTGSEVRGLARGGTLNLAGAVCSQVATLGVTVLLAKLAGTADVGRYASAYALLALLNLLALSGLKTALTRFVAVHLVTRDIPALRGVVRLGVALSTVAAALLCGLLQLLAPWLADSVFHDAALRSPIRVVALALVAATYTDAVLAATQGFRSMRYYALIGLVFEPMARLCLTAFALLSGAGVSGAVTALLVSQTAAAVIAAVVLHRMLGRYAATYRYDLGGLFSFSMVNWLGSIASTGLIYASTLMLSALADSEAVGIYNVATRLVQLATFVMLPINASFSPRIADLTTRGETAALHRVYQVATSWILRLSLPAFTALLVFPGPLLRVFGREFAVGATVTVILALGKIVDAGTGPCAMLLTMSGRPLLNTVDNVAVLVLNLAANLLLIPRFGIEGAALAWAVSLAVVNTARVLQVRHVLHMLPFGSESVRGGLAAVAALGAGLLVRDQLAGLGAFSLPAGLAVVCLVYLAVLALAGWTAEDRLVAEMLLRRAGRGGPRGADGPPVGPPTTPPVGPPAAPLAAPAQDSSPDEVASAAGAEPDSLTARGAGASRLSR